MYPCETDLLGARRVKSSGTLAQMAYDHLLSLLMGREILPGDVLNRRQIAQVLRISVAPVLEACIRLQTEGILQPIPRYGTKVCSFNVGDYEGQRVVRRAIESRTAQFYCGQPVLREYEKLKRLADAVDIVHGNHEEWWEAEIHFHNSLARLSGLPVLEAALLRIMRKEALMGIQLRLGANYSNDKISHRLLLDKLCDADPEQAAYLIREHLS